jgi:signal transduction histidine kinase
LQPGSPTEPWDRPAFAAAARGQGTYSTITVDGQPVRLLSRPFPEGSQPFGVIQAAYPLTELRRAIAGLDRALLTLIPVSLLCAGLGGFLLTDRVLRPVRRLTQAAARIGAEDLSERLPVAGQEDEFGELAATFNGMLGRLEETFRDQERLVEQLRRLVEQQRRFTADASHELRTPLTVIKANTSLCKSGSPALNDYQQSVEDIDRAADSMSRLVHDLLLLARSDGGQLGQNRIALPIKEVLERATTGLPHQQCAPIRIEAPDASLCVHGNEDEMIRLFANLLKNAVRYTPPEGCITVTAVRDGSDARVSVTDTGIGIPPEHLPHLGERFYRVDPARSRLDGGTGLGLSICKSIVEAHGGTIAFESEAGVGTTVTVTLPVADLPGDGHPS